MKCPELLRAVLDAAGIPFTIEKRGKHPHIVFQHKERLERFVFSATPSDSRATLNARSRLRRLLRGRE